MSTEDLMRGMGVKQSHKLLAYLDARITDVHNSLEHMIQSRDVFVEQGRLAELRHIRTMLVYVTTAKED